MVDELKSPLPDEVQWRNIRYVVRTLADWAFGGKDDPRWGTAWLAMVNGLSAKDGPILQLEPLSNAPKPAPLPDEVREMVVDLRCFEHPNHTGESLMQKAADLIERLSAERDSYKAMLKEQWAAGVPPDCVVVPREATRNMIHAATMRQIPEYSSFAEIWEAMIAAGEVK